MKHKFFVPILIALFMAITAGVLNWAPIHAEVAPTLSLNGPSTANVGQEVELSLVLSGSLPANGQFRTCMDVGDGSGAQCSSGVFNPYAVNVTYNAAVQYMASGWIDVFFQGQWHFYGDVAKAQHSVNVIENPVSTPTLSLNGPSTANVGQEVELSLVLSGSLPANGQFRTCMDVGDGSGAQCSSGVFNPYAVNVTYNAAVQYMASGWIDVFFQGQWHFYGDVAKAQHSVNVIENPVTLYLPHVAR